MEIYEKDVFEETVERKINMCNNTISAMHVYLDKGYNYEPFVKTKECCEEYKSYLENVKDRNFDELTEREFVDFDYKMHQNYLTQAEYLLELLNMDLPKEVVAMMGVDDEEKRDSSRKHMINEINSTKLDMAILEKFFEDMVCE